MLTSISLRRALALVLAPALLGAAAITLTRSDATSAAAATVYSVTVAGTDVHTLDPHVAPYFIDGGGVAAGPGIDGGSSSRLWIFEAPVDLPVGAKVTSVSFSYRGCGGFGFGGTFVFGSYNPTTLATTQNATVTPADSCARKTVTKTGSPLTTVAAGRRYEVDWSFDFVSLGDPGTSSPTYFGSTVKYTCTAPCVP